MSGSLPLPLPPPSPPPPPPLPRQENPETEGGYLWLRKWRLTVGTEKGDDAVDLSELAFEFNIEQSQVLIPWPAVITIYNIDDDVVTKMQKELTHVILEAGYRSAQYGKVFQGVIAYYKHGRLNATDTFVEIHAVQSEQPITQAVINTWLPAGYTKLDVVKACVEVMSPFGVTIGQVTDLGDEKSPRGRVLHGMASEVLRDTAHTADAQVFIGQDGHLHLLGKDEKLKMADETVPILNSKTGLIGVPTLTLGAGVEATCLLNPSIKPGGQVRINQADIVQFDSGPAASETNGTITPTQILQLQMTQGAMRKADGYYTVISVRHTGQNRGNPWYSILQTYAVDPSKLAAGIRPSV